MVGRRLCQCFTNEKEEHLTSSTRAGACSDTTPITQPSKITPSVSSHAKPVLPLSTQSTSASSSMAYSAQQPTPAASTPMTVEAVAPSCPEVAAWLNDSQKRMLINNEWVRSVEGGLLDAINPATGDILARFPDGGSADVDAAVAAARAALAGHWGSITPAARSKFLWKMGELIDQHIEELAELETLDQGKPHFVGRWAEIPAAAEQFRFFAGMATKIEGSTIQDSIAYQPAGKEMVTFTTKEPVGVVGAIIPWNSPIIMLAMKLAPALAAGCTVVLKPAEDTSLTALRIGEMILEAGFPAGVVNIVTGLGSKVGVALANHNDVAKVAFTGSTATGRDILKCAAKTNLKKVTLELGGKSPMVVMPDADLDLAIQGCANAIFFNGGQVCVAGSRLYVHKTIFDQVVNGIAKIAKEQKLGHGLDKSTQIGPLVSLRQADRVRSFIERAVAAGATVVAGGDTSSGTCFVQPTVIAGGITASSEICQEEVFGPVLVCMPFEDVEDVPDLCNDSVYGLAASVWTTNLSTAHRLSKRIKSGTVWVNSHLMFDPSMPIGGMKQSGWGRESGVGAVENYLELKTVSMCV